VKSSQGGGLDDTRISAFIVGLPTSDFVIPGRPHSISQNYQHKYAMRYNLVAVQSLLSHCTTETTCSRIISAGCLVLMTAARDKLTVAVCLICIA